MTKTRKTLGALTIVVASILAITACSTGIADAPTADASPTVTQTAPAAPAASTTTTIDPAAVQTYLDAVKASEWQAAFEYAKATAPTTTTTVYKPAPKPAPKAAAPAQQSSGGTGNGFLECVKRRESGGSYTAVNPSSGAGGAYQFMPSTWAAMGGTGSPQNASPAEQDRMAQKLYATAGTSPWAGGQYSC